MFPNVCTYIYIHGMYVCMHVCMCMLGVKKAYPTEMVRCMYVCMYVCMYANRCVCVCVCVCVDIYACMARGRKVSPKEWPLCECVCMRVRVCIYIHTYIHTYIHIHTPTPCIHTYIHAEQTVYANFNHLQKLGPQTFDLWMQIMRASNSSRLWLLKWVNLCMNIWCVHACLSMLMHFRFTDKHHVRKP
jgi:hypothetical protein